MDINKTLIKMVTFLGLLIAKDLESYITQQTSLPPIDGVKILIFSNGYTPILARGQSHLDGLGHVWAPTRVRKSASQAELALPSLPSREAPL